mmetsp:Transcript_74011/g.130752  ORF Transcript_74011/g.130752 Transcript_74011/m.130752 type:complete len:375 (+) Transcript_74011:30-1154(+)
MATFMPLLFATLAANVHGSSTILLLRHCPRTPYFSDLHPPLPPNNFTSADDFSARPFPSRSEWGVPEGHCTDAGLKAAGELGSSLRTMGLGDEEHVRVIADNVSRCVATAAALRLNLSEIEVDMDLFDPLRAKLAGCEQPDWNRTVWKQVQAMHPELKEARSKLPALQEVLGMGQAPALELISDTTDPRGFLVGGLRVASEVVVENFDLERASSMEMAWGRLTEEAFLDFMDIKSSYFKTMYGGMEIAQRYASGLMALILEQFSNPRLELTVLAGHDLNVMALGSLLGLEWECGPYPRGSTTPLSGFLFNLQDGRVFAKSVCHTFGNGQAPLAFGSARFPEGSSLDASDFTSRMRTAILPGCVKPVLEEESTYT